MKTEKHIDWEEVYTYHKEHPIHKKDKPILIYKRRWQKKPSTPVDRLPII